MLRRHLSPIAALGDACVRAAHGLPLEGAAVRALRYCHRCTQKFPEWENASFLEAPWKAGPAERDEMADIAWRWQSVYDALMKASLA
jgi:hypothetical protein